MVDNRRPHDPLLQQSRHSIHKPCITLHKEHDSEGKMRKENTKIIVRSSYFQHKVSEGIDEENSNEDVTMHKREDINPEHECKSATDAGKTKIIISNRKAITRSSYFVHKPVNENYHDTIDENIGRDDLATTEYTMHESDSSGYLKSAQMKRKVAPVDSVQMVVLSLYRCLYSFPYLILVFLKLILFIYLS